MKLYDAYGRAIPATYRPLYRKSEMAAWAETVNPLRGLSVERASRIYDNARMGSYAELQWLYNEIEQVDPILLTVAERRATAQVETDWTVRKVDAARARGYSEALATEQQAYLTLAYAEADRANMASAIEALAAAFFRGFAHVRPLYGSAGKALAGFELLDGWNFCRDIPTGRWYWNPDASSTFGGSANLQPIPRGELVSIVRPRHIDYPALEIYIRRSLGDKKYGLFLERYGVPPVVIVMPPDTDPEREDTYMQAAQGVAEGGSGAVPHGSSVHYASEARGADPFTAFLERQQQLIVLMATGGLLTSLTGATGIGQGATEAHEATWRTIIRRDCRLIATAFNRVINKALLEAEFPGRPHLAYFDFSDPPPTAKEVFKTAAAARESGYRIRQADLEEQSGYSLELVENPEQPGPYSYSGLANKADHPAQPAPEGTATEPEEAALEALVLARRLELAPVIDRLLDALAEPDPATLQRALAALYQDLPQLAAAAAGSSPATDTATAAIARLLAGAVAEGYHQQPQQPHKG